ncbi:hypothetical protein CCP3SC15_660009 [Gammaproteobacteria bacterium]
MTHPERLIPLKGRHHGERSVLVANGPSLNRMDVSFLRREVVIGLNKIYLGIRKFSLFQKKYGMIQIDLVCVTKPGVEPFLKALAFVYIVHTRLGYLYGQYYLLSCS